MQTGPVQVRQEAPNGARIVQIAEASLWLKIDDAGVLQGVVDELPGETDIWNAPAWRDGTSVSAKETDSPDDVLQRLTEENVEALAVVDEEHHLVGVVTHRSALKALSTVGGGDGA
jgi:predicted transcriptional regulator